MPQIRLDYAQARSALKRGSVQPSQIILRGIVGLVILISAIPLFYLITRGAEKPLGEILALLIRAKTLSVVGTTAGLVVGVVVVALFVGVALALGLHFVRLPWRRVLIIPAVLPLAIPSYVFTYTWAALIPGFSGFFAALFILVLTTMPYIVLATLAGLRRIDSSQIEVARTLGYSHSQILFVVILPQVRTHINAGGLLVGLYVMSDFGAVSLLNVETLTFSIQNMYKASYDRSSAAIIGLLLVLFSSIFIFFDQILTSRQHKKALFSKRSEKTVLVRSRKLQIATLSVLSLYAFLAVVIPFYVLITRFINNPSDVDIASVVKASTSTISVAFFGAFTAMAFAIPLGLFVSHNRGKLSRMVEGSVMVTHALPGVVIGLALVSLGSKLGPIYQSIALLAFAYSLLFLAKAVASVNSALDRVPQILSDVSASLGNSVVKTFGRVVFPIAAPSIGLGFLLVFLTAMKELPATLMLRPTGFDTLATEIWSAAAIGRFSEAAPFALTLVLIAAVPTFFLSRPDKLDREYANQEPGAFGDIT
jgi:iron(III) transport system permease protein